MPVTDQERLSILLEARIKDFEKNFERANRTARKNFGEIEGRAKQASTRLESTLGKAGGIVGKGLAGMALGAVGGLLSFNAAVAKSREALADFDRTAKAARNAGLDSDLYQALSQGADLAGLSIGDLDGALQALRRNSAMAATGKGELVEKLKAVNVELLTSINRATTQEERLRLIADAVKNAASETERVAIATAAFGESGQKLLPILRGGADGFDRMLQEARKLGIVIDAELLKRSEELTDQLSIASRVARTEFQKALIDLAPVLVSTARTAANVAGAIRVIVDGMRSLGGKSREGLDEALEAAQRRLAEAQAGRDTAPAFMRGAFDRAIAEAQTRVDAVMAELKKRAVDEARIKLNEQTIQLSAPSDGAPDTGNKRAKAITKESTAVADLTFELMEELRLLSATDQERRAAEASRRAGAAATDEERRAIVALNEEIYRQETALQRADEMRDFFAQNAAFALSDVITGATTAEDALNRLADAFVNAALEAALLGSGPFAGLTGGRGLLTFGAVRAAEGGRVSGPGTGTSDSIMAWLSDGEYVVRSKQAAKYGALLDAINNDRLPRFANGGSVGKPSLKTVAGGTTSNQVNFAPTINVSATGGTPDQNADAAKQIGRDLEKRLRTLIVDELHTQMRPGNMLGAR